MLMQFLEVLGQFSFMKFFPDISWQLQNSLTSPYFPCWWSPCICWWHFWLLLCNVSWLKLIGDCGLRAWKQPS